MNTDGRRMQCRGGGRRAARESGNSAGQLSRGCADRQRTLCPRRRFGSKQDRRLRCLLSIFFSLMVFLILVATMALSVAVVMLLLRIGLLDDSFFRESRLSLRLLLLAFISICIGTVLSLVFGHIPMRLFHSLINGMNRLAAGEFDTRIEGRPNGIWGEITDSFNALAHELEETEMLRSDFINNFSHEFKTPIVSILGFARLLKRGRLTQEQRMEYLDIIEEEAARLSAMATNVLNLTKVENQTILTDVTQFNLSEQLRSCALLLEKKWEKKKLELSLEFNEYTISANEELLRQVWINLLDNAIKYSPEGGTVEIGIWRTEGAVTVEIRDFGPVIPEQELPLIMNKFYQGDTSHASEGNGLGLAIVKKITELHGGVVRVESCEEETVFSVTLPDS